ncbi:MAG: DUF3575 domain-containing protein [Tannerellaceae bacterium]|nr:DUF3575 domain-containing protein [Tannerellaceae bacterium]
MVNKDIFYVPWGGNNMELERLYALIDEYRAEIISGDMPVYVDGYCASGDVETGLQLAKIRSNRVKSELIVQKGLLEKHFITNNYAVPYQEQKDVVVVTLRIPAPKQEPQQESQPQPQPVPEQVTPFPVEEPQPETVVDIVPAVWQADYPPFAIRTNLLYDAFLTPTLGVEWRMNRYVGIKLDGSFAYWGNQHGRVQKLWLISPEVCWYLLDTQPFYVGLGANIGEANIYRGFAKILSKDTGYQGHIYGGGVTVGYQLPLSSHFAIDFNLGLGYTRFNYDTFYISNDVRVYKGRDLTKNFWGPTQAGISLVWRPEMKNVK